MSAALAAVGLVLIAKLAGWIASCVAQSVKNDREDRKDVFTLLALAVIVGSLCSVIW